MAEALVKVGVNFVGEGEVFLRQRDFLLVIGKFGHRALWRFLGSKVVGVGDVGDGHRFRTVFAANPVSVRKIDSNRSRRVAIAGKCHGVNDFGGDTFHHRLAETRIDRRMVLKPLRVLRKFHGALRSLLITDVHESLPSGLAAERVVIVLYESVDKIHRTERVLHPFDVILIPKAQVTGAVVVDKS